MSPLYSWSSGGRLHDDDSVFNGLFLLEEEEEEEEDDDEEAMVDVYCSSTVDYLTAAKARPPIHAWGIYGDFECGRTTTKPINTPAYYSAVHNNNMSKIEQQMDDRLEEEIETLSLSASTCTLSSTTSSPSIDIPYLQNGSCDALYDHDALYDLDASYDHDWEKCVGGTLQENVGAYCRYCDSADEQESVWGGQEEEEDEKALVENETQLECADQDVLYFFSNDGQQLVNHLDITSDDDEKQVPEKLSTTPTEGPFEWDEARRHSI